MSEEIYLVVCAEGNYDTQYTNLIAYLDREKADARVKKEKEKIIRHNELIAIVEPAVKKLRSEPGMQIPKPKKNEPWQITHDKWEKECEARFTVLYDELGLASEERELFGMNPWTISPITETDFFVQELQLER